VTTPTVLKPPNDGAVYNRVAVSLSSSFALIEVWGRLFGECGYVLNACDHGQYSMKIRDVLIILIAGLCIAVVTEFWLSMDELRRAAEACASSPGFSCDYVPQHPFALLHSLSFALLATVVFARKYYTALAVAVGYAGVDILGTYSRLGTGFFGGNMCPQGHPCLAALRRATWFDWTALMILAVSIVLITWSSLNRSREV
jgi:hypothetical protein